MIPLIASLCFYSGDNFVGMSLACISFLITVMLIYGALMVCLELHR